jgi:sialate O-acetylesterase
MQNTESKALPFYFVQLANYLQRKDLQPQSGWAALREVQRKAQKLDGVGMMVNIDIGMVNDIHPKNKQEVGRRLALHALANEYGHKVDAEGPKLERYEIHGDSIRLFFSNVGKGLAVQGSDRLEGFALAGADRKFHWADAVIEGNTVVVRSQDVARPLAVRYAWAANPLGNLYNSAGLPASPFRTDEWPGLTFGRN